MLLAMCAGVLTSPLTTGRVAFAQSSSSPQPPTSTTSLVFGDLGTSPPPSLRDVVMAIRPTPPIQPGTLAELADLFPQIVEARVSSMMGSRDRCCGSPQAFVSVTRTLKGNDATNYALLVSLPATGPGERPIELGDAYIFFLRPTPFNPLVQMNPQETLGWLGVVRLDDGKVHLSVSHGAELRKRYNDTPASEFETELLRLSRR
jgi:hypothetical protein